MLTKDKIEYFELFYKLMKEGAFKDVAFYTKAKTESLKNFTNTNEMLSYANTYDYYDIVIKLTNNGKYIKKLNLKNITAYRLYRKSVRFWDNDGTITIIAWR